MAFQSGSTSINTCIGETPWCRASWDTSIWHYWRFSRRFSWIFITVNRGWIGSNTVRFNRLDNSIFHLNCCCLVSKAKSSKAAILHPKNINWKYYNLLTKATDFKVSCKRLTEVTNNRWKEYVYWFLYLLIKKREDIGEKRPNLLPNNKESLHWGSKGLGFSHCMLKEHLSILFKGTLLLIFAIMASQLIRKNTKSLSSSLCYRMNSQSPSTWSKLGCPSLVLHLQASAFLALSIIKVFHFRLNTRTNWKALPKVMSQSGIKYQNEIR